MMDRWLRRFLPWLLALIVGWSALGFDTPDRVPIDSTILPLANEGLDLTVCWEMADLSERVAALAGSLALVEARQRPFRAAQAAEQISLWAVQAEGTELGLVLNDLADSLAAYASGDSAALESIGAMSARNAYLRAQYYICIQEESQNE